jgi:hypothetical protein
MPFEAMENNLRNTRNQSHHYSHRNSVRSTLSSPLSTPVNFARKSAEYNASFKPLGVGRRGLRSVGCKRGRALGPLRLDDCFCFAYSSSMARRLFVTERARHGVGQTLKKRSLTPAISPSISSSSDCPSTPSASTALRLCSQDVSCVLLPDARNSCTLRLATAQRLSYF